MANGIIEDPFYRLNEHNVQWIDKEDWEYKTSFTIDETIPDCDRVQLYFKGIEKYDAQGFVIPVSDNYFDLLPHEESVIQLETSISEEKLREVFSIRTLDNAF